MAVHHKIAREIQHPNDGQWIEALDRSYLVGEIFNNTISEHFVFQYDAELKEKADKIAELLGELYQDVANKIPE